MNHPVDPPQIYTGRIIVRLHTQVTDNLVRAFPERRALELAEVCEALESRTLGTPEAGGVLDARTLRNRLKALGDPTTARVVHRWTLAETAKREIRALGLPDYHSLNSYFSIDLCGLTVPELIHAADQLQQVSGVDTAVLEPITVGANVTPDKFTEYGGMPKNLHFWPVMLGQGYLFGDHTKGSIRSGVNAFFAWNAKFDGAGIKIVTLEQGWTFDHPDLPPGIDLLDGGMINVDDGRNHGTKTLGVIAAIDHPGEGKGIVGIAPSITIPGVASCIYKPQNDTAKSKQLCDPREIAAAITVAIDFLERGDVLLLEQQVNGRPLEKVELWRNAIRLAVLDGIIVIEPAGNAENSEQYDLGKDEWAPACEIARTLAKGHPSFVDSRAIMVGMCDAEPHATNLHNRCSGSWYGSRIDCYAWGEHVLTTACYGRRLGLGETKPIYRCDAGPPEELYGWYRGTSAASAIIAGAVALIQQMYKSTFGEAASPELIREIVRNPALGTPIGNIGSNRSIMPDLAKVKMSLIPDI